MATRWIRRAIAGAALAVIAGAVFVNAVPRATVAATTSPSRPQMAGGIHKIKHVIVVMQENRSFDNYFGTFPGADGIPRQGTRPSTCLPDPRLGHCVRPFHDVHLIDEGGPHTLHAAREDIDGAAWTASYEHPSKAGSGSALTRTNPPAARLPSRRRSRT
jgi:phospholipase C